MQQCCKEFDGQHELAIPVSKPVLMLVPTHLREVHAPYTLGMLIIRHGFSVLAHIPQSDHTLIVAADKVALDVAVPADTAQLGPAQTAPAVTNSNLFRH